MSQNNKKNITSIFFAHSRQASYNWYSRKGSTVNWGMDFFIKKVIKKSMTGVTWDINYRLSFNLDYSDTKRQFIYNHLFLNAFWLFFQKCFEKKYFLENQNWIILFPPLFVIPKKFTEFTILPSTSMEQFHCFVFPISLWNLDWHYVNLFPKSPRCSKLP